jgi:SAM-dependent methyltransferase
MPTTRDDHRARRGRRLWDLAARTHYGRLDDRVGGRVRDVALRDLGLRPGESVLDVGCGTGGAVVALREAVGPDGRVTGTDNSPAMLARARRRVDERGWTNVSLHLADASRVPFGREEFDAAVALSSLSAMPDVPVAVRHVYDALRPGGRLFVFDVRLRPTGGRVHRAGTRLLRLAYRAFAGFTGADVVAEVERVFGAVRPALHPDEVGDTITVLHATKPAPGPTRGEAGTVASTRGDH